jgi:hypothetical protein
MTSEPRWHPDLLRRFVATPYVFHKCDGPSRIWVESNDLEIALSVRRSGDVQRHGDRAGGLICKVIRDATGPEDSRGISIVSGGPLRLLHMGMGTVLVYDQERSELLGFISRDLKVHELISSLIPALLGA